MWQGKRLTKKWMYIGPQTTLVGGAEGSDAFTLKCVTEEGQLNATIITHCKGDNF